MGANYYQTDDRDDYLSQFGRTRTHERFSIKRPPMQKWSDWLDKGYLKRLIMKQSGYKKHDLKGIKKN